MKLRFSLRVWMLFFTVVCIPPAYVSIAYRMALRNWELEEEAIAALPPSVDGWKKVRIYPLGCRFWSTNHDVFQRVVEYWPMDDELSTIDMSLIGNFRQLRVLDFAYRNINDKQFCAIPELGNLEELFLCETGITNDSLSTLNRFPSLIALDIGYTDVDSVGVHRLCESGIRLEKLVLDGLPISDSDVELLSSIKSLRTLSLRNTNITRKSVDYLLRFRQLDEVDVTDASVRKSDFEGAIDKVVDGFEEESWIDD